MRDVINKGLTEDVILNGAGEAFEGGWTKVKLYFMLGLPTETEEDMKAIAAPCGIRLPADIMRFQKTRDMENVRSRQVLLSLYRSRSHRSSGLRCAKQKNI